MAALQVLILVFLLFQKTAQQDDMPNLVHPTANMVIDLSHEVATFQWTKAVVDYYRIHIQKLNTNRVWDLVNKNKVPKDQYPDDPQIIYQVLSLNEETKYIWRIFVVRPGGGEDVTGSEFFEAKRT